MPVSRGLFLLLEVRDAYMAMGCFDLVGALRVVRRALGLEPCFQAGENDGRTEWFGFPNQQFGFARFVGTVDQEHP
jgi:hypothetical protein